MRRRIKRNRPTPPPSPQIKKVSVARKEISRKKVNRIIRESRNDKPTVRRQPLKLKSNNSFQPNRIEGYVPKKDRIFIIGGGPSVGKIDLSLLKDEVTMCVNASVKFVPNPTYFVTMDYSYFEKSKDVGTIQEISDMVDESYFILNVNNPNLIKDHNGIYFDKRNNRIEFKLDGFEREMAKQRINMDRVDLVMKCINVLKAKKNRGKWQGKSSVSWSIQGNKNENDKIIWEGEALSIDHSEEIEDE